MNKVPILMALSHKMYPDNSNLETHLECRYTFLTLGGIGNYLLNKFHSQYKFCPRSLSPSYIVTYNIKNLQKNILIVIPHISRSRMYTGILA